MAGTTTAALFLVIVNCSEVPRLARQVAIAKRFVLMSVDSLVVQHRVWLQKARGWSANDQRAAKPLSRQRVASRPHHWLGTVGHSCRREVR